MATEDRLAYQNEQFVVEARPAELERPGLSLGTGWEVTSRRREEGARERVIRRATTREAAVDALFDVMHRINRRGEGVPVRGSEPGDAPLPDEREREGAL